MVTIGALFGFQEPSMSYAARQLFALALGLAFVAALGACGPGATLLG